MAELALCLRAFIPASDPLLHGAVTDPNGDRRTATTDGAWGVERVFKPFNFC